MATNVPANIGKALKADITGIAMYLNGKLVETHENKSTNALKNWKLEVGFTNDWYTKGAPTTPAPKHRIYVWSEGGKGRDNFDFIIWVYGDKKDPNKFYPAIWSYERMFGNHEDKDLRNHPDLGWWSMSREDLDKFFASLK
jgi:hypothetical protein